MLRERVSGERNCLSVDRRTAVEELRGKQRAPDKNPIYILE